MERNGSGKLSIEMDEARNYLSVIIPVHPYFLPERAKEAQNVKVRAYQERILDALGTNVLSMNQLAKVMGYKGITAKLSKNVSEMLERGLLEHVNVKSRVKLRVKG